MSLNKKNKIIFFLLSCSLILGLIFGEDFSGGGTVTDFYNTFPKIENPIENLYNYDKKFPLHYLIGSIIYFFFQKQIIFQTFFILIALSLPLIFYSCLRIRYKNINTNFLFLLSSTILILPSLRSSAIWPNTHLTSLFFFLLSTYFYLKWENLKSIKKKNSFLIISIFFITLAMYSRELYALMYIYIYFSILKILNTKNFIKINILICFLSIPGIIYIYFSPSTSITGMDMFSFNFQNTTLINFSIISFYLYPFFLAKLFSKKIKLDKSIITYSMISFLIVLFLSQFFNFNLKNGGGIILKLSILIFHNYYLFYLSSFFGIVMTLILIDKNPYNFLLFFLIIFGISAQYIFMKYFEPMFLILFFLFLKNKNIDKFLKKEVNVKLYFFYFFIYYLGSVLFTVLNLKQIILIN